MYKAVGLQIAGLNTNVLLMLCSTEMLLAADGTIIYHLMLAGLGRHSAVVGDSSEPGRIPILLVSLACI